MKASGLAEPIALPLSPSEARQELRETLLRERWNGDVDGALLALHEALVNAHQHGGGATYAEALVDGNELAIQIWDKGPGFEVRQTDTLPDPTAEHGRGLWLISKVASSCELHRDHRGVSIVLKFKSSSAA